MVRLDANADLLADRVIVMTRHERQQARTARQFQRVEKLGAAKRALTNFRRNSLASS